MRRLRGRHRTFPPMAQVPPATTYRPLVAVKSNLLINRASELAAVSMTWLRLSATASRWRQVLAAAPARKGRPKASSASPICSIGTTCGRCRWLAFQTLRRPKLPTMSTSSSTTRRTSKATIRPTGTVSATRRTSNHCSTTPPTSSALKRHPLSMGVSALAGSSSTSSPSRTST
jgi:hypothetical protein